DLADDRVRHGDLSRRPGLVRGSGELRDPVPAGVHALPAGLGPARHRQCAPAAATGPFATVQPLHGPVATGLGVGAAAVTVSRLKPLLRRGFGLAAHRPRRDTETLAEQLAQVAGITDADLVGQLRQAVAGVEQAP